MLNFFQNSHKIISLLAFIIFSSSLSATQISTDQRETITNKMNGFNIEVNKISDSPIKDFFEIKTNQGIFYISSDLKLLINGNIYNIENQLINITQTSMNNLRIEKLEEFTKEMILFKAPDEKYKITVFTDTSCGYCKKLHEEIDQYLEQGVSVQYLAFPRAGINSEIYKELGSIWCADSQTAAMTKSMNGERIEPKICKNSIKEQYNLGQLFGINGTPAIIFENGELQPGYLPAQRLIEIIKAKK